MFFFSFSSFNNYNFLFQDPRNKEDSTLIGDFSDDIS